MAEHPNKSLSASEYKHLRKRDRNILTRVVSKNFSLSPPRQNGKRGRVGRISSYLQTMTYRGCNPLLAIQMALSGELCTLGGE
ncbi:MAG: hypothetical protein WBM40_16990 [Thiohalocapsa sp.]